MAIFDRGKGGLVVRDQPLVLDRGAYIDPTRTGPYVMEDFIGPLGATLADNSRVVVTQSGTPTTTAALSAAAGAPTAGHGGWIAGSVDNVDNEIDEVALGGAPWLVPAALPTGALIIAEVGFVVPSALTTRMYFAGLSDATTGGSDDDGPLSIVTGTTLVSGVTADGAGFVMSSLATDADAYYCGAVKATSVGTAYNAVTGTYGDAQGPAVVDDYTKCRVEVDVSGNVYYYLIVSGSGGREVVPKFVQMQNAAVTAATALLPIFTAASTTTTAVPWEIDYIFGAASAG